ncbi:hypothetical protein KGM_209153 [Danaus plexippus plexippus]|uniref:Uncharacterized protein n=1 Tax=Danaus plexippus plexippus TaxID=278856 RepID=A0A212ESS7_DANPL|nr:hypothetical protein KGM_209153 [Danaus plexippus plexippus]
MLVANVFLRSVARAVAWRAPLSRLPAPGPLAATASARRSRATRPARPDTAVDNLGQSPHPVKRLHEALQTAQVKRQRLSPPYPAPAGALHPIHQLAVHQHIKVQQSIVQQSIVQQHQLSLAHQSLQSLQAQLSDQDQPTGTLPPQQPSPRAASPQHKNMELALCQSMDSVNTATAEEEVSHFNTLVLPSPPFILLSYPGYLV